MVHSYAEKRSGDQTDDWATILKLASKGIIDLKRIGCCEVNVSGGL